MVFIDIECVHKLCQYHLGMKKTAGMAENLASTPGMLSDVRGCLKCLKRMLWQLERFVA
jgi:hypothetical protein